MRKQDDRVDFRQDSVEVALDANAVSGVAAGEKRLWSDQDHRRAETREPAYRRVRDAAVKDVADDCDRAVSQLAELFDERIDIEQRLGGVGVHAVARIDDVTVERERNALRKTGFVMAYDEHADAERAERKRGVFQRLAFGCKTQALWARD